MMFLREAIGFAQAQPDDQVREERRDESLCWVTRHR
jgi:hypothetical protein